MRVHRIYISQVLEANTELELNAQASHYLSRVLRVTLGAALELFDGKNNCAQATVSNITKKTVCVHVESVSVVDKESPLNIHLGIGISKGDRMDWVMQKATELGVSSITPLYTERTEVKLKAEREQKKVQHWQQIMISACEQCQRNTLPTLHSPITLNEWLTQQESDYALVLHHRTQKKLNEIITTQPKNISLLIGPEGGLSEEEITDAEKQGFNSVVFGKRVLRTETAPLTAISILQYLWGDFSYTL